MATKRLAKEFVKRSAYAFGLTAQVHAIRNASTVTVVMLHRVLPAAQRRALRATPEWTLDTRTFEAFVRFVKRHYVPIGHERWASASANGDPLPQRALLLTFDDGWRDNVVHALPILERYGVPSHVFVATDGIGRRTGFWQERLLAAVATKPGLLAPLARDLGMDGPPPSVQALLAHLGSLEPFESWVRTTLEVLDDFQPAGRAMLDENDIRGAAQRGMSFGAHGMSHVRLDALSRPALDRELEGARDRLEGILGSRIDSLSFPHGGFDAQVVDRCVAAGYASLFSSARGLVQRVGVGSTVTTGASAASGPEPRALQVMPRLHLSESVLTRGRGFASHAAAHAMFFHPKMVLRGV